MAALFLAGCASAPETRPAEAVSQYRCDRTIAFAARCGDDAVSIDSAVPGKDTLLRDAGGLTPPLVAHCAQD